MDQAQAQDWLRPDTLVVFPEHMATWLVVLDEPTKVLTAPTADKALRRMIPGHLGRFLSLRKDAPADDANQYAIFALKADEMAAAWQDVMAGIATDYGVTLAAGSALLPGAVIDGGVLVPQPGLALRNVSFLMGTDGEIMGDLLAEVYPNADEQAVAETGAAASLGAVSTPLGTVGLLLGDDAWYPTAWAALSLDQPRVGVSAHYISPDGAWNAPWAGYSGFTTPADVTHADIGSLTLGQAELRYGMAGRLWEAGLTDGLMVPLRGHLWDLGSDGVVVAVSDGELTEGPQVDAPVIANLWLPSMAP